MAPALSKVRSPYSGTAPSAPPVKRYRTVSIQGHSALRQAAGGGVSLKTVPQPTPRHPLPPPSLVVPYSDPSGPKTTRAAGRDPSFPPVNSYSGSVTKPPPDPLVIL